MQEPVRVCDIRRGRVAKGGIRQMAPSGDGGKRWAILVTGMHRSGTSVMTHALHKIGAALPSHLMPPAESNPTGHFESELLASLNDELLMAAGSSWQDWRRISDDWFSSPNCAEIKGKISQAVVEEFGDA